MASLALASAAVASALAFDPSLEEELLAHPEASHNESRAVDSSLTLKLVFIDELQIG
jgi:hypothetical protein